MASGGHGVPFTSSTTEHRSIVTVGRTYLCPDLLSDEDIGAADTLRGKVVQAFFWLLRIWPARGR